MFFKTTILVLLVMQWKSQDITAEAQDIDSILTELSNDFKQLVKKFEKSAKTTEDKMLELKSEENFMLSILTGQQRTLENKMDVVTNNQVDLNLALGQLRQNQDEIKQGQIYMKLTQDDMTQGQSQMKLTQDEMKQEQSQMKLAQDEVMEGQSQIKQALSQISENQNADYTKIGSIINATKKMSCQLSVRSLETQIINGRRYYMSHGQPKMTWPEAENFCKSHGMDLVSIETQQEWDVLKPEVEKLRSKIGYNPWCSGSDAAQEGKWKWAATGSDVTFFTGQYSKSNNPNENCLYLYTGYWDDEPCSFKRTFICEQNQLC